MSELTYKDYVIRNQTYIEIQPINDLKFRSSIGFTTKQSRFKQYASPEAYWGKSSNGYSTRTNTFDYTIIQNNQLTYSRKINLHNFTAIAGSEILKEKTEDLKSGAQDVSHPYFKELGQYLSALPLSSGGWGSAYTEHTMVSFYGIINYDYNNKYFLDLSFRTDGESRFRKDNQWGQFWSVGAQWNIKSESFMESIEILSSAKLRGSIGTQGNSGIGNYASRNLYSVGASYYGKPGTALSSIGGDDLTWEKSTAYNVGIDAGVLENRFRASIDLYKRDIDNMFIAVPITLTSGLKSRTENAAKMYNKGIEVTLSADIVRNKDWNINIEGNLSINKNEVTRIHSAVDRIVGDWGIITPGKSVGQFYQVKWAGVNPVNGDPLWYDKEGNFTNEYSEDDRTFLEGKNYLPNKTAGLTLNANYKGIGMQAIFTSIWDKWVANNNLYYFELDNGANAGQFNHTKKTMDFWKKPGDITEFPRLYSKAQQFDSRMIENQSFIRLKNVTLYYDFNKKTLAPLKVVRSARLYAMAQNLWTLTDYRGLDPEVSGAQDLGTYPASRTFTFGVELSF